MLAHRVHFQYRIKDYINRKAKSAVNTNLSGERKDDNYDAGYEILYFPDASTYASVMGAWLFNESNDLLQLLVASALVGGWGDGVHEADESDHGAVHIEQRRFAGDEPLGSPQDVGHKPGLIER